MTAGREDGSADWTPGAPPVAGLLLVPGSTPSPLSQTLFLRSRWSKENTHLGQGGEEQDMRWSHQAEQQKL